MPDSGLSVCNEEASFQPDRTYTEGSVPGDRHFGTVPGMGVLAATLASLIFTRA